MESIGRNKKRKKKISEFLILSKSSTLLQAEKIQKAAKAGFDWDAIDEL